MTKTTLGHGFWTRKGLVLLAATLLLPALLTACDVEKKSVEDFLTRAEEFRKKGDLNASIIEAKNALQVDAGRQDARFILGVNYLDLGAWSAAEAMLEKVMRDKGVLEYATIPPLARAKIALGKYDQVLQFAEVKEGMKGSLKAEVLVVRGEALNATGKREEAKKHFEEATREDPASYGGYIGLATSAVAENTPEKARALLAKATEIAPDAIDVLQFRGLLEFHDKNYEASKEAFRTLIGKRPERPDFYLGQARAEIALGEYQQAIKTLEYPLKVGAKHAPTNYLRALAAFRSKDYQSALTYAEVVLNLVPGDVRAQLIAGSAAFALGRYEMALDKLKKVLEKAPELETARELLGLAQIRLGQNKAAYATLSAFGGKEDASASMLALLADAALLNRDLKAGSDYLERALALDPDNARARALLATTMVDRGDIEQGISELRAAVSQGAHLPRAEIVLILSLLKAKRYEEALKAVNQFHSKHPDTAIGYTLEGGVYLGLRDAEKARNAFEKAFALEPGRPDAGFNLAILALHKSDVDGASHYLREILKHHPAHARTLIQLWQLEDKRGRTAELEPLMEKAIEAEPRAIAARTFLGRILLAKGQPRKALGVVSPGLQIAAKDIGLLDAAGKAHFELKEYDAAIAMFQRFLEQRPNSAEEHFLLALSYQGAGQLEAAVKALERTVELNAAHANARFLLTRLYTHLGQFDAAGRQIATLKTQLKDSSALAFLEAELLQAQGKHAEAAKVYANMPGEPSTQIIRRLAQAQWRSDQRPAAIATLQGWLDKHPDDRVVKLVLGSYLAAMKRTDEATALFKDLIKSNPSSWVVQNEIAWTLYEAGDAGQALPYAQRARELAPQNPMVADTLAMVLLEIGSYPQALLLLREAVEKMPDDPNLQLHLAQALVRNDLRDEARHVLTELLAVKKEFADRPQAAALLKKLDDGT